MNQTSESVFSESSNPWKKRSELPEPAHHSVIVAAVLFLIAGVGIPFSLTDERVAVVVWGALVAGGYFLTRRFGILTLSVIGLSFLGAILPGTLFPLSTLYFPAVGAVVAAICVGCCAGAYFQTVKNNFWVLPLLSVVGAGAVYGVTRDWTLTAMPLSILPAAMLLGYATEQEKGCTTAICYGIGGLLLGATGLIVLWIWRTYNGLTPELLRSLLAEWKEYFVQMRIASREELMALIDEKLNVGEDLTEEMRGSYESLKSSFAELLSDTAIQQSMDALFQIFPALLFLCCSIPVFLAQRLLNSAYTTNGLACVVTPEAEFFTMSLPSAVLYVVSLFLSVLAVDGIGFLSMVASNLCLILLPGMLLLGLRYFKQQIGTRGRSSKRVIILLIVVMLCFAMSGMLYLGAFFGAYMRIMQAVQKAIRKKMDQGR